MTYKVWLQIEELDEEGEPTPRSKDLVLPDSLGQFDTLDEAMARQREVLVAFNPEMLRTSDVRPRGAVAKSPGEERRLLSKAKAKRRKNQ